MRLSALKSRLTRTHNAIIGGIESAFKAASGEGSLEILEEALITADVGVKTTHEIVGGLRKGPDMEGLKGRLRDAIYFILKEVEAPPLESDIEAGPTPFVIMVLGVNGVGKTTTIGKLAARFTSQGKNVLLGAADTFRAAGVEQLEIWGERVNSPVIKHARGSDPGAVAFDSIKAAIRRNADCVILDTAGRLHTREKLMEELKKVKRVVGKALPGAPHENLLVLDASTGQNSINQARLFNEAVGATGIALVKLDGTAKGGIIIAIAKELKIPVRFIGVGEGVEDLRVFNAREFAEALI
jgi:fused signal recognition particle receptor